MHICFLSSKHPPLDKRAFAKEACSLAANGYEVTHLAPGDGLKEERQNVIIKTYRSANSIFGRFLQLPILLKHALQIDADCYHCNEVDSWVIGIILKLIKGKRVVFDVHEHYASTFAEKSYFPLFMRPAVEFIIKSFLVALSVFTDRIVFAKESVAGDFIFRKNIQITVRNFTSINYVKTEDQKEVDKGFDGALITAIHFGLFSRERGWPQLLDALKMLDCGCLSLRVIGTFYDGSYGDFKAKVEEYGLSDRVFVKDWMPFDKAWQYIQSSHIGLVLFQPCKKNFIYAFPHKLFDYMSAGLPSIIPAFAQEIAPIVREADSGILVDTSDPRKICAALKKLVEFPDERMRLGENGKKAVINKYNWECEAKKLLDMYKYI